jgi:DNA-binding NtrC family response regulator
MIGFPRDFAVGGDDYAFNLMSMYIVNLMKTVPLIVFIGGFLFYILRAKEKPREEKLPEVLVVDDDPSILLVMGKLLYKMGYHALTSLDGADMEEYLKNENVKLVLLDIHLSNRSGMDILKEINKAHPEVPVIMLTALGYDDKAVGEATVLGASGYVSKTSGPEGLKEAIENVMLTSK